MHADLCAPLGVRTWRGPASDGAVPGESARGAAIVVQNAVKKTVVTTWPRWRFRSNVFLLRTS
jgi:hypothetical protein